MNRIVPKMYKEVGTIENNGKDSVGEVRELRKKLSEKINLDEINSL